MIQPSIIQLEMKIKMFMCNSTILASLLKRFVSDLYDNDPVANEKHVSIFETRFEILLSMVSRREGDFLSFSLAIPDKNEKAFLSISSFETRARISFF